MLLTLALASSLAGAADVMPGMFLRELEKNLTTLEQTYATYSARPSSEEAQANVALVEGFITAQVFSVASDASLYRAALTAINRRAASSPGAIAELGTRLQTCWEADYLVDFYLIKEQQRRSVETPIEILASIGSVWGGSRALGPALSYLSAGRGAWAELGQQISSAQGAWKSGSAATLAAGSAGLVLLNAGAARRLGAAPPPPASLIRVSLSNRMDFRLEESKRASHRRILAKVIGGAGAGIVGELAFATAKRSGVGTITAGALALGGSMLAGFSLSELSEWSFAALEEGKLAEQVSSAFAGFLRARQKGSKQEIALRRLMDALIRLQSKKDLELLMADLELSDRLNEIDWNRGEDPGNAARKAERELAFKEFSAKAQAAIRRKGGPLLAPLTVRYLARERMKRFAFSPFNTQDQLYYVAAIAEWPALLRPEALTYSDATVGGPAWASMRSEAGLELFRSMLQEEEAQDRKVLADTLRGSFLLDLHQKPSEFPLLLFAAYFRSLKDPSLSLAIDSLETRIIHYGEKVLELQEERRK